MLFASWKKELNAFSFIVGVFLPLVAISCISFVRSRSVTTDVSSMSSCCCSMAVIKQSSHASSPVTERSSITLRNSSMSIFSSVISGSWSSAACQVSCSWSKVLSCVCLVNRRVSSFFFVSFLACLMLWSFWLPPATSSFLSSSLSFCMAAGSSLAPSSSSSTSSSSTTLSNSSSSFRPEFWASRKVQVTAPWLIQKFFTVAFS
mmetsp:Transcript_8350/g.23227  ORF Transcript_8350/g.23227 Transcript_8350/m.23227 type:complete len:204 (+) Transcript_8350:728-1339(+)